MTVVGADAGGADEIGTGAGGAGELGAETGGADEIAVGSDATAMGALAAETTGPRLFVLPCELQPKFSAVLTNAAEDVESREPSVPVASSLAPPQAARMTIENAAVQPITRESLPDSLSM